MDLTWVTDRIGVGGGIWNDQNMGELVRSGVTHIINMQIEFDDRPLAENHPVEVCHNPTDDDFQPKPARLFHKGVQFAVQALEEPGCKVFIHCAAGVHRAPMMTLALLRVLGWPLEDAKELIQGRRTVVDFADVYVESVEAFVRAYDAARQTGAAKTQDSPDLQEPSSRIR
jgi:protein-tyrosine phosphatase